MRTLHSVLGAALMTITIVAWSSTPPVNDYVVRIDKLFSPDNLEIKVGDTVQWKNFDSDNHTVTAQFYPGPTVPGQEENYFDSGMIASGGSYEWVFPKEGTCKYYCSVHRHMSGTITVRR